MSYIHEPWKLHSVFGLCRIVSGSRVIYSKYDPTEEDIEEAERIVFCVNAMAGIKNNQENFQKYGSVRKHIASQSLLIEKLQTKEKYE